MNKKSTVMPNREAIIPLGTETEWGEIVAVLHAYGERKYLIEDGEDGMLLPACVVEAEVKSVQDDNEEYYAFVSSGADFSGLVEAMTVPPKDVPALMRNPNVSSCGISRELKGADARFGFDANNIRFLD